MTVLSEVTYLEGKLLIGSTKEYPSNRIIVKNKTFSYAISLFSNVRAPFSKQL